MTGIAIRPATPDDIPEIAAIYGECVLTETASFELEAPDEAEMGRRMRILLDGGYPYVVAADAGRVCGYAYAGPYHARPGYRHTVEDSVYLAAEARGQRLGRALLDVVIGEAEARGFRQMIAIIGDSRHTRSIRLHQAAGFEKIGTLRDVGYKHGRWLDSVLMQRSLGHGAARPPHR